MLVTISGPAGSGKSTAAAALAEALDYDHVSGGDIFRDLAVERGITPLELNKLAEDDDEIDRDLDRRLRGIAETRDDVVLESRLAGWKSACSPAIQPARRDSRTTSSRLSAIPRSRRSRSRSIPSSSSASLFNSSGVMPRSTARSRKMSPPLTWS